VQIIKKWFARCELVLVYLAVLATFGMMCLTSADALSRYLLNRPIIGAYELTEKYLAVAAIFLGLSYAYRGGVFIRVTFLVDRLPRMLKVAANFFAHLVTLAFCLIILVATTQQALRGLQDDTTLSALPILLGPAYSLAPLGFLALTIILLIDLPRVHSGRSYLFREETPPA
jgi:TRAP-type C4-dicarboxylate transport system permease small subunit